VSFGASKKAPKSGGVIQKAGRKEINLSELKKALDESLAGEKHEEPMPEDQIEEPKKEDKNKGVINPGQKIDLP